MLTAYVNSRGDTVNCSNSIKVYTAMSTHNLWKVDDQLEEFHVSFVLRLKWKDPNLKYFRAKLTLQTPPHQPVQVHSDVRELEVIVIRKHLNGDLEYMEVGQGDYHTIRYEDYMSLSAPDWQHYFFPKHSFTNMRPEEKLIFEQKDILWCDETGGFVEYKVKYDARFSETLELRSFPLDRQICRIKCSAELPAEKFQFVPEAGSSWEGITTCDMWCPGSDLPGGKKVSLLYVRYCDKHYAYPIQRSCATILIHLDRDGSYYFHSVLLMVFMVNLVSLCGLRISLSHLSGRLGHLITCFLAVLAYRYVIDDKLPQKQYMTAADWYILSACVFLVLLCIETVILSACGREGVLTWCKTSDQDMLDRYTGFGAAAAWILGNAMLYFLWKCGCRSSWSSVYADNEEPYFRVCECPECKHRWLRKQFGNNDGKCKEPAHANVTPRLLYHTPLDHDPVVQPQPLPEIPQHVKAVSSTGSQSLRHSETNKSKICGAAAERVSRGYSMLGHSRLPKDSLENELPVSRPQLASATPFKQSWLGRYPKPQELCLSSTTEAATTAAALWVLTQSLIGLAGPSGWGRRSFRRGSTFSQPHNLLWFAMKLLDSSNP